MRSIQQYVERRVLGWMLPVLAGISVVMALGIRHLDLAEFDEALEDEARRLATLVFRDGGELHLNFADEFMPVFSANEGGEYFHLRYEDGREIERSRNLGGQSLPFRAMRRGEKLFDNLTLPDGRRGRYAQVGFTARGDDEAAAQAESAVVVTIAKGREPLDALLLTIYLTLLIADVFVLLLVYGLVRSILARGFRPLEQLNEQLSSLSADTLGRRIELPEVPEELGLVVGTLNRGLEEIEVAFRREQRFTGDVAHELRTPVAEIRLSAEIGAKWPKDAGLARERFMELRQSALEMEEKVAGLLELSRLDSQNVVCRQERIRPGELVARGWAGLERSLTEGRILENRLPEDFEVWSDGAKWEMMLGNLLKNAATYGREGTAVVVEARRNANGRAEVRVSNETDCLAEEDVAHVFERFWRKDAARTGGNHAGLGLSIVRALAERLGVEVGARLEAGRFVVTLGDVRVGS